MLSCWSRFWPGEDAAVGGGASPDRKGGAAGVDGRLAHHLGADIDEQHLGKGQARAVGDAAHLLDQVRRKPLERRQEGHGPGEERLASGQRPAAVSIARHRASSAERCEEHVGIAANEVAALAAVLEPALIGAAARFDQRQRLHRNASFRSMDDCEGPGKTFGRGAVNTTDPGRAMI